MTAAPLRCARLLAQFNTTAADDEQQRREVLAELLGSIDPTATVKPRFTCSYGDQITVGAHALVNYDCLLMDDAAITTGEHALIGPRSQLLTARHPVEDHDARRDGWERAEPITLGASCWLAAGVLVGPGGDHRGELRGRDGQRGRQGRPARCPRRRESCPAHPARLKPPAPPSPNQGWSLCAAPDQTLPRPRHRLRLRPGHDQQNPVEPGRSRLRGCRPMGQPEEVPLWMEGSGPRPSNATRRDDVVLRQAGPWSPSVIALLRHLADRGFTGAPEPVGSGFAADGREALSFIDGTSPHPYAWSDEGAFALGELLRAAHDATRDFRPPPGARWQPWHGRDLPGDDPIIGHCDPGRWNVIARHDRPVALIDWEFAGPVDAVWELAHAAWLNAQLHDDDIAEHAELPDTRTRLRHAGLIAEGYRLPTNRRQDLAQKMISFAVFDARDEAVKHQVTPETRSAFTADAYPILWAVTWRTRSAAWMLRHQHDLERHLQHPDGSSTATAVRRVCEAGAGRAVMITAQWILLGGSPGWMRCWS